MKNLSVTWHRLRRHFASVWALAAPYFVHSNEKGKARGFLLAIVGLNLASVAMLVFLADWRNVFYNALQDKNEHVFWVQLGRFAYLALAYIAIMTVNFYMSQLLEMRWRRWMTQHVMGKWLASPAFYELEIERTGRPDVHPDMHSEGTSPEAMAQQTTTFAAQSAGLDNPDQRIQEDVRDFTTQTMTLFTGVLNASVTLFSFVGLLWHLSSPITFTVAGQAYVIGGFMVWAAITYCLVGSWLSARIGRPLVRLNFLQQQVEANFRHRLVMVRENSAAIALEKGQMAEALPLRDRLGHVLNNMLALIRARKNLLWFTQGFSQAAVVFPFIVQAPRFFRGSMTLGGLMQTASAFNHVQDALSWFVSSYSEIATWRATTERLTHFQARIQRQTSIWGHRPKPMPLATTPHWRLNGSHEAQGTQGIQGEAASGEKLQAHDLHIYTPAGTYWAQINLILRPGQSVWLQGPSGCGKSMLLKALAGTWPYGRGEVIRPTSLMFVPQRPYMPTGTLRALLSYPRQPHLFSDEELQTALRQAQLGEEKGRWVYRLDEEAVWSHALSVGEQQRMGFARVFLQQPRFVLLDEATSALDAATETRVYEALQALLASYEGSMLSVAHHPSVAAFHQMHWRFEVVSSGQVLVQSSE